MPNNNPHGRRDRNGGEGDTTPHGEIQRVADKITEILSDRPSLYGRIELNFQQGVCRGMNVTESHKM